MPYSLSRWTDVPGAKWDWMMSQFKAGGMIAFDQRTAVPSRWSLDPAETLGLVWWTKDPTNLVRDFETLRHYRNQIHVTITGWHEAEKGVPYFDHVAADALSLKTALGTGSEVIWRFSPAPIVPDALDRFQAVAEAMHGVTDRVYLSFLQPNDRVPETRTLDERIALMLSMAKVADGHGMRVLLCNEDLALAKAVGLPANLSAGVCAEPSFWAQPGATVPPSEGCGCAMMVDPFTVNESCTFGCTYCYASDQTSAPKKRNTTRSLPVVP